MMGGPPNEAKMVQNHYKRSDSLDNNWFSDSNGVDHLEHDR